MLVLARRENQSIRIHTTDGIIEILITKLDERNVRLGFAAPNSVTILRSEIDASAGHSLHSGEPEDLKLTRQQLKAHPIKSLLRKLSGFASSR